MKKISFTFIALLFAAQAPFLQAEERPEISIQQAVKIAETEKNLRDNGSSVYIESISLQRTSLLNGKTVWIAKWSEKLPANDPRDRDVGVEISMDGHVKHIVKGPSDK